MKKNKLLQTSYYLLFVFFFYLFIKDSITNFIDNGIEDTGSTSNKVYYVIGFIIVSLVYLVVHKNWPMLKLDKSIIRYNLFIIFFTLFHSIFTFPLKGIASVFLFPAPLIIFLFVRNIVIDLYENRTCIVISVVLFLALSVVYLIEFQQLTVFEIELHNIYAYVILLLLPIVLCSSDKKVRIVGIIITSLVIVTSFKRGGLIAFLLGFIIYLQIIFKLKQNNGVWNWIGFLLIVVLFLFVLFKFDSLVGNVMGSRFVEQEGDYSSGRIEIYQKTIQMVANSSPMGILFGHGYNAVARDSINQMAAHNDFLEIFYDYGLFGFLVFLIMIVQMIKRAFVLVKRSSPYAASYSYAVCTFIVLSSVSTIIRIPMFSLCAFYTFGYLSGQTYDYR
ncbi:MAG: O-antigen ligase family protein [Paludibacteraceae bacterium]|nr:O-antigen ligase family protein [Paludibacteraceae bacterium]